MFANIDDLCSHIEADEGIKIEYDYLKFCERLGLEANMLHSYFKNTRTDRIFKLMGLWRSNSTKFLVIKLYNENGNASDITYIGIKELLSRCVKIDDDFLFN